MVFPDTRRDTVMISDFAFSHWVQGEPDIGALKQCLPFNLCPPEVLKASDIDGLLRCMGTHPSFSAMFSKEDNFRGCLFAWRTKSSQKRAYM